MISLWARKPRPEPSAAPVYAPFTPAQVDSIRDYQRSGGAPLYCQVSDCRGLGRSPMVADLAGLFCYDALCHGRSDQVPEFMTDWTWQELLMTGPGRRAGRAVVRSLHR